MRLSIQMLGGRSYDAPPPFVSENGKNIKVERLLEPLPRSTVVFQSKHFVQKGDILVHEAAAETQGNSGWYYSREVDDDPNKLYPCSYHKGVWRRVAEQLNPEPNKHVRMFKSESAW